MSNTGKFFQQVIDVSRGKSHGGKAMRKRRNRHSRTKTQILFEKNNALLKEAGGSVDDPTTLKGFGKKRQKRFAKRKGILLNG